MVGSKCNRSLFFLTIIIFLLICSQASANPATDKAKMQIKAKMYPQAIAILEKEIQHTPDNVEAHYNLGICYLNMGRLADADARFNSASAIDKRYAQRIASIFRDLGNAALTRNDIGTAVYYYQHAIKYQSNLKSSISEQLIKKAKVYSAEKKIANSEACITAAIDLDDNTSKTGCLALNELMSGMDDNNFWVEHRTLTSRCQAYSADAAKRLLSIGRSAVSYDPDMAIGAATSAITIRPDLIDEGSKIFTSLAVREYAQGRICTFKSAMDSYYKVNPYANPTDDRMKALRGLYWYETGDRIRGLNELKKLRMSTDKFANLASNYHLTKPEPGQHDGNMSTRWEDLGWSHNIEVILDRYEIMSSGQIKINFLVINRGKGKNLIMYGDPKNKGKEGYFPYLLDDNGKKYPPIDITSGGDHEIWNGSGITLMYLNEGESGPLEMIFPAIEEGARSFKFVSPSLNGWQWEWSLGDIRLKPSFDIITQLNDAIPQSNAINRAIPFLENQIWAGHYECRGSYHPFKLFVKAVAGNVVSGVFEYNWKNAPTGSFSVQGMFKQDLSRIIFEPRNWISQPEGHTMYTYDMTASPDGKILSGVGVNTNCGIIKLFRQ